MQGEGEKWVPIFFFYLTTEDAISEVHKIFFNSESEKGDIDSDRYDPIIPHFRKVGW